MKRAQTGITSVPSSRPQPRPTRQHADASAHGATSWPRRLLGWGLLLLLGTAAFGVTFALVRWSKAEPTPPTPPPEVVVRDPALPTPTPTGPAPANMVWVPGGEFTMGTNEADSWQDEKPAHRVRVHGFWMDATEVTNAQFRAFVEATGYVTTAEKPPDVAEIMKQVPPGTPPPRKEDLVAGSLVFTPPSTKVKLNDFSQWWKWTPGADWKHPAGPTSNLDGKDDHPVVQVSWDDAVAYAKWAGKRLPTEAEWECAARGGLDNKPYVWGDDKPTGTRIFANLWQGEFPIKNTAADGYERTAPVKSYAPNGYQLYDMAGNVWEWCADWYQRDLYRQRVGIVENPTGPRQSSDASRPFTPQRVQKGGSFLCNDDYCSRYRPSARHGSSPDTGMSHVGFRCVQDAAQ